MNASRSVRWVTIRLKSASASKRLLLPAASGPKTTVSGSNSTSASFSDLYPWTLTRRITSVSTFHLFEDYSTPDGERGKRALRLRRGVAAPEPLDARPDRG